MADHGARKHATWSASASDRRWGCPGSLALEAMAPEGKTSYAAVWGTAAHEVAEAVLRGTHECCADAIGQTIVRDGHSVTVDDEVAETAQVYVDYVVEQSAGAELLIEQKFSLAAIDPPFDAGGLGDAVILHRDKRMIEVVDLKGGRGIVVEALGNKQLRTYGLGAALANPGAWRTVKVTIVQPRAPHADGRIRSEEFDIVDLMDWTADLKEAMGLAALAKDSLEGANIAGWAATFLNPGDHCVFCAAKPTCPAIEQQSMELAQSYFTPQGEAVTPPAPDTLSMERIVTILDHADMIEGWLNSVRAYAQDQAESGVPVKSGASEYILVPKQARRKMLDTGEATIAKLAELTGRDRELFEQPPKVAAFGVIDKLVGKDPPDEIKALWTKESSGFNLVRSDKTTKPAALPPAQQFLKKGD